MLIQRESFVRFAVLKKRENNENKLTGKSFDFDRQGTSPDSE